MEDFFSIIEEKIKASGYTEPVNGEYIYDLISDEIEDQENGSYIFMSVKFVNRATLPTFNLISI